MSDRRRAQRYLVDWRAAIVNEDDSGDQRRIYARCCEISEHGLSIACDINLHFSDLVVILVSVPSEYHVKLIEIESAFVWTHYSGSAQAFKAGFQFRSVKGDGLKILRRKFETLPKLNYVMP